MVLRIQQLQKYFVYSSLLAVVLAILSKLIHLGSLRSDLIPYLVCLSLLTVATILMQRVWSAKSSLKPQLWHHVFADNPILGVLKVCVACVHAPLLLYLSFLSSSLVWLYGGTLVAYGFDALSQYENAERVFEATCESGTCSFANWSGRAYKRDKSLSEAEMESTYIELDNAVSRVYGPNSEQMLDRLESHAFCISAAFRDSKLAREYLIKALNLVPKNHPPADALRILDALCIEYSMDDDFKLEGLFGCLTLARELTSEKQLTAAEANSYGFIIERASRCGFDVKAELAQLGVPRPFSRPAARISSRFEIVPCYLLVIFSLLLLKPFARRLLLQLSEKRWRKSLLTADSVSDAIEIQGKLIALAMYRGERQQAYMLSTRSLDMAENLVL